MREGTTFSEFCTFVLDGIVTDPSEETEYTSVLTGLALDSIATTEVLLHLDEWIPGLSDYFPGEHTLGDLYRRSLAISCHGPR